MRTFIFVLLSGIALIGCNHPSGPSSGNAKPGTAVARLSSIDALAKAIDPRLRLKMVKGDKVMRDGFCRVWHYAYGDTTTNSGSYWLHADSRGIGLDSVTGTQPGVGPITRGWCNSDSAMRVAEREGGADFRRENPVYTITASLRELDVANRSTRWWIDYRSHRTSRGLRFVIDASTGDLILMGP